MAGRSNRNTAILLAGAALVGACAGMPVARACEDGATPMVRFGAGSRDGSDATDPAPAAGGTTCMTHVVDKYTGGYYTYAGPNGVTYKVPESEVQPADSGSSASAPPVTPGVPPNSLGGQGTSASALATSNGISQAAAMAEAVPRVITPGDGSAREERHEAEERAERHEAARLAGDLPPTRRSGEICVTCLRINIDDLENGAPPPRPVDPGNSGGDPNRQPAGGPPGKPGGGPQQGPPPDGLPPDPITQPIPAPPPPGSPLAQNGGNILDIAHSTVDISQQARGDEIINAALAARGAIAGAAANDQKTLARAYDGMDPNALGAALSRAQSSLGSAADTLENAVSSSLDPAERARFRNYFLDARDKAQLGLDALQQGQQAAGALGGDSPFSGLLSSQAPAPTSMAAILGQTTGSATTTDALVNRLLMLNGLPDDQKALALQQLRLLERPAFTLASGAKVSIDLLHNGYVLGGGGSAVDCSSFVSTILPTDVRKGRFTTLDFRMMWIYARYNEFPNPPRYTPERAKLIKDTSTAFKAIDLYAGEPLAVGDLLVYRLASDPIGHVVIVRSYNASLWRAEVVEAAQSAGTVRERVFDLSADPLTAKNRALMPGLLALRIRPVSTQGCYYRDGVHGAPPPQIRAPASGSDPGGTAGGAL